MKTYTKQELIQIAQDNKKSATHARVLVQGRVAKSIIAIGDMEALAGDPLEFELGQKAKDGHFVPIAKVEVLKGKMAKLTDAQIMDLDLNPGAIVDLDKKLKVAKLTKRVKDIVNSPISTDRSAAIAATWKDAGVAKARSTHNKVMVDGTEYRSVAAAFQALGLPMKEHITFRAQLKRDGKASDYNRKWEIK